MTDEEFTGLFINALIVLGVLTFLGCLQTLWKFLKGRNVVHPTGKKIFYYKDADDNMLMLNLSKHLLHKLYVWCNYNYNSNSLQLELSMTQTLYNSNFLQLKLSTTRTFYNSNSLQLGHFLISCSSYFYKIYCVIRYKYLLFFFHHN